MPKTTRKMVSYCAKALRSYFPRLIPVEAVVESALVLSSVTQDRFVYEKEIQRYLRDDFSVYRDWGAGAGFVDAEKD